MSRTIPAGDELRVNTDKTKREQSFACVRKSIKTHVPGTRENGAIGRGLGEGRFEKEAKRNVRNKRHSC